MLRDGGQIPQLRRSDRLPLSTLIERLKQAKGAEQRAHGYCRAANVPEPARSWQRIHNRIALEIQHLRACVRKARAAKGGQGNG